MNKKAVLTARKKIRLLVIGLALPCLVLAIFAITKTSSASTEKGKKYKDGSAASAAADPLLPPQIDVRGGTPRGLDDRALTAIQTRALTSLKNFVGNTNLNVRYNGLTATPMFISNPTGYLTQPSSAPAEQIARDFIGQWSSVFRFDQNNLDNLKLMSRAVSPEGITVMLFQQQANNLPVYHGEVLVNVNKAGQIMTVGGDSFPQMNVTNTAAISPATAVSLAATNMGINGFTPVSLGAAKILTTYGDLTPEYQTGQKFDHNVFTDDIDVQTVVFPLGDTGRIAYKFNLTSPAYHNIVWMNIVDAESGAILKRTSLTSYFGESGGGTSIPRKGSFRPDVQNMIEANNANGTARGKVFDTMPTTLSKVGGTGRAIRTGTTPADYMVARPTYDAEAVNTNPFRYSIVAVRNEDPLPFTDPVTNPVQAPQPLTPGLLGQSTRGFPDATNPNSSSPFGWFYLPTGSNGTEITDPSTSTAPTRIAGYTMAAEAKIRNLPVNSPSGNGDQPFSADITSLGNSVTLPDGRVLSSVFQSRYTEGNNVSVSDDHENDNDATKGVRGYSANRQFSAAYFDYYANYEFGGVDASGGGTGSTTPVTYPASSSSDVYPDTANLFFFNNIEHDYLYSIGFTEPFWNFQFDNFGKGGAAGDAIIAEVQDGSGTDNANMSTPAEGANPRMQMYLFTDGGFRRSDGDIDWDVVAHEHYHGVSNRSAAKGGDSCLGTPLVGESGGMGEGWSDTIASSMSDDDLEGEYVTGQFDNAIRRLPYTNYRYSYGSINDQVLNVRKNTNTDTGPGPDANPGGVPYEVHDIGEIWAATLWDMRELMIVKQKVNGNYPGIFFDGSKRMGNGTQFYVGDRAVKSVDTFHPINYRQSFLTDNGTTTPYVFPADPTLNGPRDVVRPKMLATENAANPSRNGPLATAVTRGARLADTIVLRGLQLAVCNPTFVDMRDSMLAADREITGGENQSIIYRSFASHGVGTMATSTGKTNGVGQQGGPAAIVEDFTVPADVTACELLGPLPAPTFLLQNNAANAVTVTITPVTGATTYVIARSTSANGPFTTIATQAGTTYTDNNLALNQIYYYQVHAARNASCVGSATTNSILITVGAALSPAPVFAGVGQVADPKTGKSLNLSWSPASSTNVGANIVYDIYRVINVVADTDLTAPMFTPAVANRIAQGVTGVSYTDTGLTLGQQYYYVVTARDTTNNKIDNNNLGNTVTKLNAPSSNKISPMAPFTLENFETTAADNRFTAPLMEPTGNVPAHGTPAFQRVKAAVGGAATNFAMFAPDFDPGDAKMGGPSDFAVTITPTLTLLNRTSFLEFDHRFDTEATFDGGNVEILLGAPTLPVTPSPNNATTFDLNDYIVDNPYNGALNGSLEGAAQGSVLMGRRSFTGSKPVSHVRIPIGDFATGGVKNPNGLPVYIRFHSTSDAGTFVDGWYIDNVVVNNFDAASNFESDVQPRSAGDGVIDADDIQEVRRFVVGLDMPFQSNEFQRADSSPRSTSGDGYLDADDVQQARRYSVATDALQPTNGPATANSSFAAQSNAKSSKRGTIGIKAQEPAAPNATQAAPSALRIDNQTTQAGQTITVPVKVDTVGNEYGYSFSLSYNPAFLSNPVVSIGNAGGDVVSNTPTAGNTGFSVTSFSGGPVAAGNNLTLVFVKYTVAANAPAGTVTPITFTDNPTRRKASPNDPNMPITQPTYTTGNVTINAAQPVTRALRVGSQTSSAGQMVTVPVQVDANGDETGYSFSLSYDSTKLTNPVVTIGNAGGDVVFNANNPGQIGFSVTSFSGANSTIAQGTAQVLVNVKFTVAANVSGNTSTPVAFTDTPARRKASGVDPNTAIPQPTYTDGTVNFLGSTAATSTVSGRALTAQGRGISGAIVTMRGTDGKTRTVKTNAFGYYNFTSVESGKTYIFSAADKRYSFRQPSQALSINEDTTDINFIGK